MHVEGELPPDEAERRSRPRDDLVLEREVAPGRFECAEGPFRSYERRFEQRPDGTVVDHTEFSLDIGVWRFLFTGPFVGRLAKRPADRVDPFWAPPDRLDRRAARVLALVATISLAVGYLGTLLTQTNTYVFDEFGTGKTAQGATLATVRVGILLAVLVTTFADRRGRKRAMVITLVAGCVLTAATAASPNLVVFGGLQTLARGCNSAVGILVAIIAAEEMPKGSRAYAVSLLAMATGLGAGLALILLPLADLGDAAWRVLFVVPLLFLPAVRAIARHLPESRRFEAVHDERAGLAGHGGRFWLLAVAAFLGQLFIAPASQFMNEYLRDERGFDGAGIRNFSIFTNLPGSIGIVVAGKLADVRGRRMVGAVGMFGGVLFTALVFNGTGASIWAWSALAALIGAATIPALGVYGPELFPTAVRGRANGIISVVGVVGSAAGLLAAGTMSDSFGSLGPAMAILAVGPAILTVLIVVAFPETAREELESLNPEDRAPGSPAIDGAGTTGTLRDP